MKILSEILSKLHKSPQIASNGFINLPQERRSGDIMKCMKCSHEWNAKGKSTRIQCPKCKTWVPKVKTEKVEVKPTETPTA